MWATSRTMTEARVRAAIEFVAMQILLDILFSLFAAATLGFWALFFLVVLPRIHERCLILKHRSRFGFLSFRWPFEELEAYAEILQPQERSRCFNLYLLRAWWLVLVSLVAPGLFLFWAVLA